MLIGSSREEEGEILAKRGLVAKSRRRCRGKQEMGWNVGVYKRRDHASSEIPGMMLTIVVDIFVRRRKGS